MACQSRWRTERILLRRFVNADAATLAEVIFADADVMKTLIGDASTPERQLALASEWIARWDACWEENGYGVWALELADASLGAPGTLIGFNGFEAPALTMRGSRERAEDRWPADPGPEIIAGRGSAWWSRGISGELGGAIISHLFEHTDSESIHALVFSEINPAASHVSEKHGLSDVGEVPIHARLGPTYQRETLRFELQRVCMARPGREEKALFGSAFKVGQLLGCHAARPDELWTRVAALTSAPGARAAWDEGLATTPEGDDHRALGNAWLDLAVERRLRRLTGDDAEVRTAALELGRLAGAVTRDIARAEETLCENAAGRGLAGEAVRARIHETLHAGLGHATMRLFRRKRSSDVRA